MEGKQEFSSFPFFFCLPFTRPLSQSAPSTLSKQNEDVPLPPPPPRGRRHSPPGRGGPAPPRPRGTLTDVVHTVEEPLEILLLVLVGQHGQVGGRDGRPSQKTRSDRAVAVETTPAAHALDAASEGGAHGGVVMQTKGRCRAVRHFAVRRSRPF